MDLARSRWALLRGARRLWSRGARQWRALPAGAARRWGLTLAVGMALTAAVMALLTLLARGHAPLAAWDRSALQRLVDGAPFSFQVAVWWEAYGASSMLIPVAAAAATLSLLAGRLLLALTFAASYLLAKPIVLVGWTMWDRARPTLVADGLAAPALHSYPSGHAFQAAAIYGLLVYLWLARSRSVLERALGALLWLALVAMVGVARLRMGVHWPSDVIAGTLAGVVWLLALVAALRRGENTEPGPG